MGALRAVPTPEPDPSTGTDATPEPAPHLTAEAAVLGALMIADRARADVPTILDPDHLDREAHRIIYRAILAVLERGDVPDPITVNAQLCDTGQVDAAGGLAAVWACTSVEGCPTPSAYRSYVQVVTDAADRRRQVADHLAALRALGVDVREVTP